MIKRQQTVWHILIGIIACVCLPVPVAATDAPLAPLDQVVETPQVSDEQSVLNDDNTSVQVDTLVTPPDGEPAPLLVDESVPTPAAVSVPLVPTPLDTPASEAETNEGELAGLPVSPEPEPPVELELTPIRADADMIVSGFEVRDQTLVALEVKNRTKDLLDLSQWQIAAIYLNGVNETVCQVSLAGYLLSSRSTTLTQQGVAVTVDHQSGAEPYEVDWACGVESGRLIMIEVSGTETHDVVERVMIEQAFPVLDGRWVRKSSYTGELSNFYKPGSSGAERLLHFDVLYQPPVDAPLLITELYVTPHHCAPATVEVLCFRYVKVTNTSQQAVDLAAYRLRAGLPATHSTATNTTPLSGVLAPGETRLIVSSQQRELYLDADEGTAWFEDRQGVTSYQQASAVTPYAGADTVARAGLSWAFDQADQVWKWSLPSPATVENVILLPAADANEVAPETTELVPCRDDQYRSPETNRCRRIASATSSLVPCRAGQYRSAETNRCRTIASTASTLTPCRDDQYRSETTNRCRLISPASSELVPCKENQYRNETTNRCRTIASATVPAAAFAVEPIAETGKAFIGWWLLGGATAVALGYAAWEWRREVMAAIRAVGHAVTSRK